MRWPHARPGHYALLLAVSALLTLPNLGAHSLWDIDEGVNAGCAREMREADTWIIPTFNYELRTAKPVMLYWLQRVSYAAFGVGEWSARLPSVLAGWLTVLLVYELARRMFGPPTGLLAGLVLATAVEFCMLSHAATPDATLLLFTVLTYYAFWVRHENGGRRWWVPTAAACGLAALTKGPVGVVLPGLVILLYFAWNRELRRLLDHRIVWGALALLAVAGPWYAMVAAETRGAWVKAFFVNENVNRALTPMEDHRGPIFYHAAALFVLFAPWSVFLGATVWYAVKWARALPSPPVGEGGGASPPGEGSASHPGRTSARGDGLTPHPQPLSREGRGGQEAARPYRFLVCWVFAYLLVFSLVSTKLPNYVLPLYPALAILTARFLVRWRDDGFAVPRWLMPAGVAGTAVVGLAVGVGLLAVGGTLPLPEKARVFPGLAKWAVLGVVPLAAAAVMAVRLRAGDRRGFVTAAAAGAVLFVGLVAAFPPLEMDRYKAPRELVRATGAGDRSRDVRLAGLDWFQPSVVFYAGREVAKLPSPEKAAEFLAVPTPGYLFVTEPVWNAWLAGRVAVPHRVAARRFDFYRNCDVLAVTNEVPADGVAAAR